jgi:hypothetical protein
VWALTKPPEGIPYPLESGVVRLLGPRRDHPKIMQGSGWTAKIGTLRDAMALGAAALMGHLPGQGGEHVWGIQIHASEIAKGIWVSRGAHVDPAAELVAPVLIGPGAIVRAGARVGPEAFIGERAVIEKGAVVTSATVAPATIIGEGLEIHACLVAPEGLTELEGGPTAHLEDSLLIGNRDTGSGAPIASRALALALLCVLAPAASIVYLARALFGRKSWSSERTFAKDGVICLHNGLTGIGALDLVPRLVDVLLGARSLIGVTTSVQITDPSVSPGLLLDSVAAPWGAIDIEPALVPDGWDVHTRLRGRAWYAQAKSKRVDLELLRRLVHILLRRAPLPAAPEITQEASVTPPASASTHRHAKA